MVRSFYNESEVVIIDFLMKYCYLDDSEKTEDFLEEYLNFSKNHIRETLRNLEKGLIVENREGKISINGSRPK